MRALRPWHKQPRAVGAPFLQVLRAADRATGSLSCLSVLLTLISKEECGKA